MNHFYELGVGLIGLLLAAPTAASLVSAPQQSLGGNSNFIGASFGVPGENASFDYIICGGGTAGLTMAARLAETSNSVAVIEAGGFYEIDNGNLSVVPVTATRFAGADPNDYNPLIDWDFVTTPQAGVNDRQFHYARGKTLGGSSARNYMAYQRASNDTYAMWASEVGDDSYSFDTFLPYFKKSVNFTPPNNAIRAPNASAPYNPAAFSPEGGPLHVSFPKYANPFSSWFVLGLESLDVAVAEDFVSGSLNGVAYQMQTVDPTDATRSSSESSYLRMALMQTDIQVYKNTMALKVMFDEAKNANGVQVNTGGLEYALEAKKEVIVSAGAFQSPQLLMVSGIGPKEVLNQHDINILSELPGVGQNMWDHFFFGPSYQVDIPTHSQLANETFLAEVTAEYRENATGIVTNTGADIFAWQKIPEPDRRNLSQATRDALSAFPPGWPELEYIQLDAYLGRQLNYVLDAPQTPYNYEGVVAALVAPLSRGNITIISTSTLDPPVINPNWLTDPADVEIAVAAYKRLRRIVDAPGISDLIVDETYPGRNVSSDADILETIKESGLTVYHAAATCKMGRANDSMAVVDPQAKVYGVQSLRVVDASAFPFLPPGHPQSTVYALAEKIADDIIKAM